MKTRQKHRGIWSFILTMAMLTAEIYPLSMPLAVQAEGEEYVVIDEENSVSAEEVLAEDSIQEDDEDIAEEEILEATPESAFEWDGDVITGYLGGGPDVVIPKRAIAIGREAFQKNTDIQRLFFEEGSLCKSISTDACYKAENLTYVVLPESLEIMGARAFAFCDLKEIIIPENVTTIRNNVFSDNKSLSSVTINSKNIEQASTRIFNGCAIERLSFTEGITKIPDDLFSRADFVEGYRLVIPDNVTEIGNDAFALCGNIVEVHFPEGLETIGARAFYSCDLKEVNIPKNVKKIKNNAFQNNTSLWRVAIKAKDMDTDIRIFEGCSISNISFPEGITKIPDNLFSYADFVEEYRLEIPESVTEIGTDAFALCGKIAEVHFPEGLETIGARAFYSCDLKEVNIPKNVKEIKNNAFQNNTSLGKVVISANDLNTHIRIFEGCSINSITFPEGITKIPDNLFAYAGLAENTTITIPDSVTVIGSEAFTHIDVPYSVVLPKNLEEIEFAAFSLSSLSGNIVFPLTLRKIVNDAFLNCNGLQKVTYAGSEKKWNNLDINKNGNDPILPPDEFLGLDIEGFDLKKDGYCVANMADAFSYYMGWPKSYNFPLERYQEVFGKSYTKDIYNQRHANESWGGSCGGMSITSVLFYKGLLPLTHYIKDKNKDSKYILTDDGYDKIKETIEDIGFSTCYYYKLNNNSDLTKLIERYDVWGTESAEFLECRYIKPNEENLYLYSQFVSRVKSEKEPFVILVNWNEYDDDGKAHGKGHALVVNSSKTPEDRENGWVRIYLYDPNHPYFSSSGNKTPYHIYDDAENRYIDINTENGQWRMDIMVNSAEGKSTSVGFDENGNLLNDSRFTVYEVYSNFNDFENKTASFNQLGGTNLSYSCDDFSVYDSNNVLIYKKENRITTYINNDIVTEQPSFGYVEGIENTVEKGILILPSGKYRVNFSNGTISFEENGDYAGVLTADDNVSVVNTSTSSLAVTSEENAIVDLVVMDAYGEGKYTSVCTDVIVGEAGCDISLIGNKLNINTKDDQKFDIDIIADNGYGEALSISSNDVSDLDVNELISDELKEYTITYDLNGGTVSGNPTSYNRETGTFTLENPTKDGFEFLGWTGSNGDIPETYVVIGLGEKGDRNYKANWNDGSSIDPIKPDNGAAMNPAPVIDENTKELHLIKGQKFTLTESGWTSSNKKCLSISKKNAVTVKKVTTTPVKLTKGEQSIDVYITKPAMGAKSVSLKAGEEKQIVFNYDYENLPILWYSNAPDIATVSQNGMVTAHSKGTATITAYVYGSAFTCKVKVSEPTIAIERSLHITLNKSKTVSLKGIKKPVWTADNKDIVTIKGNKFKGIMAGETTLRTEYDGKEYLIHLYVEDPTISTTDIKASGKNKYTVNLKPGDVIPIEYSFVDQEVVYKSSKGENAYYDDGNIVANKPGKAKLTAKVNGKTITINVIVAD